MFDTGPQRLAALGAALGLALTPALAIARPDPVKLEDARSLTSEAQLVETAERQGRVTHTYAQGVRDDLVDQLGDLLTDKDLGPTVRQVLAAMGRHDTQALAAIRDRLVKLERADGRAD